MSIKPLRRSLLLLCLLAASSLYATGPWLTVEEEYLSGLSVRLLLTEQPKATDKEWICLEIVNEGIDPAKIKIAQYRLEFQAFAPHNRQAVAQGSFSAQQPSDFLDQNSPASFTNTKNLAIGTYKNSRSISRAAAALLGYPEKEPLKVKALLYLNLVLEGEKSLQIQWPEVEFSFLWYPPNIAEQHQANEELVHLLHHPEQSVFQDQRLSLLLANPASEKDLQLEYLLKAIKIRSGQEDGRLAIVKYLNDHFAQEASLQEYYRKLLHQKDFNALSDLIAAPDIWTDQFLEPLIVWFQNGNSAVLSRIMEVLYVHQKNWIAKNGIATIFSDLIIYKYEEIIYKSPIELSDRELLVWSSAASMLGKTGNPEVLEILKPFLTCKVNLLENSIVSESHSQVFPPPLRVADVALEALLLLNQKDLKETYQQAGYYPPYAIEESNALISTIRDRLIIEYLGN